MQALNSIAVYGGGSWGTALACAAARRFQSVDLYMRDLEIIKEITSCHTNKKYFGNTKLPDNIRPSNRVSVVRDKAIIIIAVPSKAFVEVIDTLHDVISKHSILLIATKGFIGHPTRLLSEVVNLKIKNHFAFIQGPNFAIEVVQDLHTATTIACADINIANMLATTLASQNFVITTTQDIITVQLAGAMKNIIAIQSGMYDAMGYQKNAKAWLITQGLQEIYTVAAALKGSDVRTMLEPAVVGDLVLTCYAHDSRNTKFGYDLINSQLSADQLLQNYSYTIEGIDATKLMINFMRQYELNLPIVNSVARTIGLL